MVNETFWFLYLVQVTSKLGGAATFGAGLCIVAAILVVFGSASLNELKAGTFYIKRLAYAAVMFGLVAVGMPEPIVFYGGAAQYVGEATELDETLLSLKTLIDDKISELTEEVPQDGND